jgi:hypothetical protein
VNSRLLVEKVELDKAPERGRATRAYPEARSNRLGRWGGRRRCSNPSDVLHDLDLTTLCDDPRAVAEQLYGLAS